MHQYAYMGLIKALDLWDGVRAFEPLACQWVRGAAKEYIRDNDTVPRSIRDCDRLIRDEQRAAHEQTGQCVTPQDAASRLGWSNDKVDKYFRMRTSVCPALSLEGIGLQPYGEGEITLKDTLVSSHDTEAQVMELQDTADMMYRISRLPPRERIIIEENYFCERPLAYIAVQLGISASRALQLKESAILRLRVEMTGSKEITSVRLDAKYITKSEHEIVRRMAKGMEEEAIAKAIGVSQRTVQFHTATLRTRFNVSHTWQLLPILYNLAPSADIRWD